MPVEMISGANITAFSPGSTWPKKSLFKIGNTLSDLFLHPKAIRKVNRPRIAMFFMIFGFRNRI
jgi:hypothetical protein